MTEWMNERINRWINERIKGLINKWVNENQPPDDQDESKDE